MRVGAFNKRNVIRLDGGAAGHGQATDDGALQLVEALARSDALPPLLTARDRMTRGQWEVLGACLVAGLIGVIVFRTWMVVAAQVAFWLFFSLTVVWRLALTIIGRLERLKPQKRMSGDGDSSDLPVYSILIALRHEANMMPQLARNLAALDWPGDRLEILLLVEADDELTRAAIRKTDFPAGTACITVPPGSPMTKPRALNYGLACARGELVTVYDAEDCPHPDQLRQAAACFARKGSAVLCVQAPLICNNRDKGWLPAQWALEYSVQFGLHIPALAGAELPIMLGGTSNHFRRADLIGMGGWDAWNVTEDADLGLRIARLGGRTAAIRAGTLEAAPRRLSVWLNQRSRWIKGFMQTWLVCMRTPVRLLFELGWLRWLSLQLTLGGAILSAFLYGPMSLLLLLGTLMPQFSYHPVDLGLFACGWVGCALADIFAPGGWSLSRVIAIVTRPLYWPLQTLAGIKALGGLALRPSFWAKTPHSPERSESEETCQSGSFPPS